MSTENIMKFLKPPSEGGAYTDEKLAALLAHAQDGKLGFGSCCCLIGIPTSGHALQEAPGLATLVINKVCIDHYYRAKRSHRTTMEAVEDEFHQLSYGDEERRAKIIPLILTEMARRELLRTLPDLPLSEQLRLEEEAAAEEGAAIEASNLPYPEYERNGR